jgi:hypothetical protein
LDGSDYIAYHSKEFESLIPKFKGLRCRDLEFGCLGLEGLKGLELVDLGGLGHEGLKGLEFEPLVSDPFVSNPRPSPGGSGLESFLGFDLSR